MASLARPASLTVARMLDLLGPDAAFARWSDGARDTNIEQQSSETRA
jgi:hypothetical protein